MTEAAIIQQKMLEEAANIEDNHVIAIILNRNYGQHSAIMAGFNQADGDLVITLDADLQNPPEEIPRLVATAEEGMMLSELDAVTVKIRGFVKRPLK